MRDHRIKNLNKFRVRYTNGDFTNIPSLEVVFPQETTRPAIQAFVTELNLNGRFPTVQKDVIVTRQFDLKLMPVQHLNLEVGEAE